MVGLKNLTLNCLQQCKRIFNESNISLEKYKSRGRISTLTKKTRSPKVKIKITEANKSTIHIPLTEVTNKKNNDSYRFIS